MPSKISQQPAEAGAPLHAVVVRSLPFSHPTDARQPSSESEPPSGPGCIPERCSNYGLIRWIVFKHIYSQSATLQCSHLIKGWTYTWLFCCWRGKTQYAFIATYISAEDRKVSQKRPGVILALEGELHFQHILNDRQIILEWGCFFVILNILKVLYFLSPLPSL